MENLVLTMITQLFEKKDDHMKTVTVTDWTAITVYEIREAAMHYLFNRSPGNIFTLHFGSSGRVKQRGGKGQPRKQKHAIAKEQ